MMLALGIFVLCRGTETNKGSNQAEQQQIEEDSDPDDIIVGTQKDNQEDENQKTDTKKENGNQKVETNADESIQLPEDNLEDNGSTEKTEEPDSPSEEPDSSQDEVEDNDSSSKKPIVLPGIRID